MMRRAYIFIAALVLVAGATAVAQIQVRRGTPAAWTSANPTLQPEEIGAELGNGRWKLGDGASAWNALPYVATPGMLAAELAAAPSATGRTLVLSGNTAHGDGGGGTFVGVSCSGRTVDSALVYNSATAGTCWLRLYSGPVDPRWWGCVPDWTATNPSPHDNLTCWQSMLASLRLTGSRGGAIRLDGWYYFSGTLHHTQLVSYVGSGSNYNAGTVVPNAMLVFPASVTGLRFHGAGDVAESGWTADGYTSAYSSIPGAQVHSLGGPNGVAITGSGLTGATFNNGSATVTLNGTAASNVLVHDSIYLDADTATKAGDVQTVTTGGGSTTVTLVAAYTGAGGTGAAHLQRGHGIHLSIPMSVDNVYVDNFGQDGIAVLADHVVDGGNASGFAISNSKCGGNGRHGIHVEGGDANAGLVTVCNVGTSKRYGYYVNGTLGSIFIGCQGSYNSGNLSPWSDFMSVGVTNLSQFFGCYSEGWARGSVVNVPGQVIGGTLAGNCSTGSTGFILNYNTTSNAPLLYYNSAGAAIVQSSLGAQDSSMTAFTFSTPTLGGGDHWDLKFDNSTQWWGYQLDNSAGATAMQLPSGMASARVVAPLFPNGVFYGAPAALTRQTYAAAAPSSGVWAHGDIVWNSAPAAGGTLGWVCVTGGDFAGVAPVFKVLSGIAP